MIGNARELQRILAIADTWDNGPSPAIERIRIGGKSAVTAAKTSDDRLALMAAQDAAISNLTEI